ncbi:MAG: hypothetical protein IJK97_10120, partial [Thermoguttaceae bacterium]|nr:hypothetical protein [Thermoguttaceae bacterium]
MKYSWNVVLFLSLVVFPGIMCISCSGPESPAKKKLEEIQKMLDEQMAEATENLRNPNGTAKEKEEETEIVRVLT